MRLRGIVLCAAVAGASCLLSLSAARAEDVTGAQVQKSIDKAVEFLRRQQNAVGTWPDYGGYPGGVTCLATLSLLTAGVPESDPAIQKALAQILKINHRQTYVVSLKAMALCAANPVKYKPQLTEIARWLVQAQVPTGQYEGMWRYTGNERSGDNSNTQYAVLGLDACARAGVVIDRAVWTRVEKHFRRSQNPDGGWGYIPILQQPSYGSMTAAGLGSMYLSGARLQTDYAVHRCGQYQQDKAIADGINWFAQNFSVDANPKHGAQWLHYYLYGLERVGMISSRKFLGTHNWYKEGAAYLVQNQTADGYWGQAGMRGIRFPFAFVDQMAPLNTSFSLLFLAKGRAPVLIQKVEWRGDWSNDIYDIDHLVRFIGAQWKHPVSWQVVQPRAALEDLLDAPILFFNGHTAPNFDNDEKQRLREYIDQGGFLLAEACCGREAFDRGFRDLMRELLPDPEFRLKRLADDHPVYSAFYNWTGQKTLEGIDIHCRTAVVFIPNDLSCAWHQDRTEDLGAFHLGTNICAYATGMEPLKDKLDVVRVARLKPDAGAEKPRGALVVGKVRHNGNWNMDAFAVPKLLADMTEKANLTIVTKHHPIALTDKGLYDYPLVYLSGSFTFTLSDEEKTRLREYLKRGGVLFANALCGKQAFDTSFRALIRDIFPDEELKPLPLDHPVYSSGYDIRKVQYTRAVHDDAPNLDRPVIEGIAIGNRTVVFYSKYDIGCALDSGAVLHGKGYLRPDAFRIASNIVLYALSF